MTLRRYPAESEYKRNPELSKTAVQNVLAWTNERDFSPSLSEEDAILFLASCNYDEEFAQKTINLYYGCKSQNPEIFFNIDPLADNFCPEKAVGLQHVLPGTTKDGCKVLYTKLVNKDNIKDFSLLREAKIFLCQHDLMMHEEGAVPGWQSIIDMDDTSLWIITRLQPSIMKKLTFYLQEACPVQNRGIHIVNPTPAARILFGMVKPFLNASVLKQFYIHNSLQDLYEHVPKSILPANIGGDLESAEILLAHSMNRLLDNRDILLSKRIDPEKVDPSKTEKGLWRKLWG